MKQIVYRWPPTAFHPGYGGSVSGGDTCTWTGATEGNASHIFWHDAGWATGQREFQAGIKLYFVIYMTFFPTLLPRHRSLKHIHSHTPMSSLLNWHPATVLCELKIALFIPIFTFLAGGNRTDRQTRHFSKWKQGRWWIPSTIQHHVSSCYYCYCKLLQTIYIFHRDKNALIPF